MNFTTQRIVRFSLVIAVLAAGAGVKIYLDKTRPEAAQKPVTEQGELVELQPVVTRSHPIHVEAQGRVIPARELSLQAEVSGRIRYLHDDLVQGGRVKSGEVLVRIDPRDYQLAAEAQKAAVDRSRLELQVEKGRKAVAEREVKLLREGTASELARREPQLRTAMNALNAAESGLERANLLVSKTTLRAPFNAIVLSEATETGQLVGPGAPLARLVGTDHFWVQVAVSIEDLSWIAIPGVNAETGVGSTAVITQDVGGEQILRQGRVLRLAGDLDPAGQMARLIVEIDDPFGLEGEASEVREGQGTLPMLLGAFVEVEIAAGALERVVEVPRAALRDEGQVYLMNDQKELEMRTVKTLWREEEHVYIRDGLKEGESLIISRLPAAIPGMKLRVKKDETPGAKDEAEKPAPRTLEAKKPEPATDGKPS